MRARRWRSVLWRRCSALAVLTAAVAGACPQNLAERDRDAVRRTAAHHRRGEGRADDARRAPHVAPRRRLLGRRRRPVRRPARPQRALGEPARRRRHDADGHSSGSAARCTATSRTPASASPTAASAAATGGTRIPRRRPTTPSSTSPCGTKPPFGGEKRGHVAAAAPVSLPRGDRVQHATRRPRPRLGDLPPRADRRPDDRLHQPAARRAARRAPLAAPGRARR